MKQWVRNRVIEINRLTNHNDWFYIESENMTADLGTRKGVKVDVLESSIWFNGHQWAKSDRSQFPIKSINQIRLCNDDLKMHNEEILNQDLCDIEWVNQELSAKYSSYAVLSDETSKGIRERYQFSKYIIDPNKFRFRKVVRVLALVLLFIKNLKDKINKTINVVPSGSILPSNFTFNSDSYLVTQGGGNFPFISQQGLVVALNNENLIAAINYFYKKATLEIKHFQHVRNYQNNSTDKFGILY